MDASLRWQDAQEVTIFNSSRYPGLDPGSRFFCSPTASGSAGSYAEAKAAGPRIKSGVTGRGLPTTVDCGALR